MCDSLLNGYTNGKVLVADRIIDVASMPWHEHPQFSGVALKHLITGGDTEHTFSCHLVRISKGCEIGNHIHEGKWELHEVLQGKGTCLIGQQELAYQTGISALIPADVPHRVTATDEDLYIAAKFAPALI